MLRAFFSSATGMRAQELLIDNTANNIANVNTNGFKRSQLDFADLMYATMKQPGADAGAGRLSPTGLQIGSGVRPVGTTKVFTTGVVQDTGNPTDVAIQGDGFFEVRLPSGELAYTRDGAFRMSVDGNLVTGDGYEITSSINIPQGTPVTEVSIGTDGTVSAGGQNVGVIQLVNFRNPAGLANLGSNNYRKTGASGDPIPVQAGTNGTGSLLGGYLEKSNVEVVNELVSLITAQRAYEINSRAIRAGDEMLSTTSQIVR
jgi:flagellar basal-body rod protein FlgG